MFCIIGLECALAVVTSVSGMAGVYTESVKVTRKLQKSIGIVGGCKKYEMETAFL